MPSVPIGARKDLTDRQWRVLEPLLPDGRGRGRPPKWSRRQLVNGVRWRTRVGAPWRDVPERYGHWQSVYRLFRCFQRAGVWALIWAKLMAFAVTEDGAWWFLECGPGSQWAWLEDETGAPIAEAVADTLLGAAV
ncbi:MULTISPECIES: transposase [Actinomadura]|uniref:transposase n=1 Tax=Actinomadura TaxID=1988 RepID=UPI000421E634|nr:MULTISPECIES: transposase [Actinomadura]